jgi:predicted esterase YcpF (UPF0227 family)
MRIKTYTGYFVYDNLRQKNMYAGVEKITFLDGHTHLQAKPLKALADYIGKNNLDETTVDWLTDSMRIEQDDIATLTAADFDELQSNYGLPNVENFLSGIRNELGL